MAADLALSLAAPFIEYMITPLRRQCGYILFYRSYLRELEEGVDKLKVELEGIRHKCEAAERNAMDIETKVTNWIDGVNGAVKEAHILLLGEDQPGENTVIPLDDFQSWFKRRICLDHPAVTLSQAEQVAIAIPEDVNLQARKRFFYLNPVVCYKKGRKAKKTTLVVQELNERIQTLGEISYEASTSPILSSRNYESFTSRKQIIENIVGALSNANVPVLGVWGMGGVGKSMLIKEVIRLAQENNLFDDVAVAVVSQNPDVKKIQGELAVWLGLNFKDDENASRRAVRLNKRLKPTNTKNSTAVPMETKKQNEVRHEENQDGMAFQWKHSDNKNTAAPVANHEKQVAVRPEESQDGWAFQLFQWKKSDNKSTSAPRADHEEQDQVQVEEMDKKKTVMEGGKPDVKQKQVLIILDDIWRGFDLEEIGIPPDARAVKLLLTSRKQHVLSSEMGCSQNVFKLEVLKDKEPWKLFESIVGGIVNDDSRFRSIGEEVVEKCSGLPIVLKAIATTLKNCSLPEWEDALVHFKGSKDAYSNLEISYMHLESDDLKSLFLVCALTNDASIYVQDLLYYSMGLGLLKGSNTVRIARDKLKALLHNLQDSSLLQKDADPDLVSIHDVVREVAIRIASRDHDSLLINDEFELKEIPRKKIKSSKAISIPYVNFRKLPEGWECPELKMFLLYRRVDDPPIGISDSFFEGMKEISVLDISGRCFDSLPSSIQLLLNLNTLCLDNCSIEDLTLIGKLKQLQILTFRGSEIPRLPKEIGELSELKVLNLDDSKLEVIEPQVLGKLTSLEELHLKGSSFIGWEDEGEMQPKNAKLSELNNLSKLSTVNIHIHNPGTIPNHLEFGNLAEYIIQIGDVWDWAGDYKESRMLKIKLELCQSSFLHEKWVQDLLKRTQNLHLDGIKGWQRSIHELCLDGFPELKHLHLQNNSLVQCVVRSISKWLPCTAFTVLESLFLEKLTGLEMISHGLITDDSFRELKVIKVTDCGKLKSLFSYSMLESLSQLKEIEVGDCEAMQVIVTVDSAATNTEAVMFQALHRIKLHNLPNFMRFCSSHRAEIDQTAVKPRSSEIVQEDPYIPTSCTMFSNDQLISFPLLKSLILSNLPKLKHIWQYNYCPIEVANLECLEVNSCDDLLIVIPSRLVKEVTKLDNLMVKDCGSLQEVFETSDGDALNLTSDDMEILSRLNKLELSNLPFLKHLWENNHQVRAFKNLNLLKVVDCSSLTNLLPAALLKSLNQLTEIYIKSCKEMKAVFPLENDGRTKNIEFQSLVEVWLEDLPNMVTFVWTKKGESINFLSLKELYIEGCPKMRSFSLLKEDESYHDDICFFDDKVQFPKLAILDLISMTSIRTIWHEEIAEQSFCQLEMLLVQNCETLVDVLPSINMTGSRVDRRQFLNLKEININNCALLEGPLFKFGVEETGNEGYCSLSQLEKLELFELPKLKHVLQPDSHVVVGFPSLVDLIVADCQCLADVFPISTAATLSKLEYLRVFRCNSMRQIFGKDSEAAEDDEMLKSILFPCLRSIIAQNLDCLISVFLGISCVLGFPSLETIDISWCSKLETFVQRYTTDQTLEQSFPFSKEGVHYLFDDKVELPNLKKVELYDLSTLQTVWKTKLPCLNICDRIGHITEITIKNCESLVEFIFESDDKSACGEEIKTTTNDLVVFHSLANVSLGNLPNMVAFIRARRDQTINFPFLKELYVESCPKMRALYLPNTEESGGGGSLPLCFFDHKVLLPKLLILDLISVGSMEKIWQEEISQKSSFCQIEQVLIKDCQKLVNVFPANMIMSGFHFQNLKKISARKCPSLEGSLFDFGGEKEKKGCKKDSWSLPQLETLWLTDLPKLQHVVEPTSSHVYSFPNLVDVQMTDNSCVLDLFPISTAPTLSKLETLQIYRCGSMRQVFGEDIVEEEMEEEMMMEDHILVLPCLRSIEVQNLDKLISFFSETSSVLHFPSLETLEVDSCAKLETFVQRYTIDELEESAAEGVHYLFDDKVLLPKLLMLDLISVGSMEKIWQEEISQKSSFCQIEKILIMDCQKLVNVFPANIIMSGFHFQNLKKIIARECPSLEGSLFYFGGEEKKKGCKKDSWSLPQLETLWLIDLPKLQHVVEPTSHVVYSFPSLVDVQMADNPCVLDLFPISTAPTLSKLETLEIFKCGSMRQVFVEDTVEEEKEEMMMEDHILVFPCLRSVVVQNLANLISFFSESSSVLHFPSLETLEVDWCAKLKTFVQRYTIDELEESAAEGVHYLFDDKVLLPKLLILDLESVGMEKIWQEEISQKSFYQIEQVLIKDCQKLVNVFPANMIMSGFHFQNLKKISARKCPSLEGSLFYFGGEEKKKGCKKDSWSLPQLETLWLFDLPKLQHVVEPTSSHVYSFPNLVDVQMADNSCVIDLFPISTAPTLSKLEKLLILRCGNMRQVFGEDIVEEEKEEEIMMEDPILVFPCLRSIVVQKLDNLINFFSETSSVLHFPSLETLQVDWCAKLKTFIQRYTIDELEESAAEGVHYLFDYKVELPNLKKIHLYDLSSLRAIWKIQLSRVDSYDGIGQIREITIKKCEKLEEFIFESDHNAAGEKEIKTTNDEPAVFHSLTNVTLGNLPNMVAFIRGRRRDQSINFPCLKELYVENCPKMRAIYLAASTEESGDESFLMCFFDRKVLVPKVVKLDLISVGIIEKIWHEEISEETFFQLESLIVKDCQNLVKIFPSNYVTSSQQLPFQNLKTIIIRKCSSLEGSLFEFVCEEGKKTGKQSPLLPMQLEKLWLFQLPKLEHVIHPTLDVLLEFQSLVDISISDCQCLINLFPSTIASTLSKLEKVQVLRCSSMRHVFRKEEEDEEEEDEMLDLISFPCLRTICVQNMNSLICFFWGTTHQLDFPSLEDLQIHWCPMLMTFVQRHKSEDVHYLFDDKVLVPKVVKLDLISVGIIEKIWHEEISEVTFFQLESLIVKDCQNLVKIFPSNYVTRPQQLPFQNLKTIIIRGCSSLEGSLFEFVCEEGKETGKQSLSLPLQLEKLWLLHMPKLEHVIHPNLEVGLELQSLVEISIADCQCLIDLFPSTTAATLSKLEKVQVLRCSSMRHVFGKEEEDEEKEDEMLDLISFPCLRNIVVQNMNSLICFFWGTAHQFDFPSLEDLQIHWCPVLTTFVQRHKSEDIHYLFDDKVELPILKKIHLYDLSSLRAVWKIQLSCVDSYDGIGQIREITIKKCEKLEEFIFESDDNDAGEKENKTTNDEPAVFHSLTNVTLGNLPNMVAFIRGRRRDQCINFPCLKELYVENCPKMRAIYLAPSTEESGDESFLMCFFDRKVLVPKVVKLDLISVGIIEKIWHEEISEETFFQLESLIVKDCQNLVKIFPSNYVTRPQQLPFQNLKTIIIRGCSSLEGSLFEFVCEEGKETGKKSFSLPLQLEKLWLFHLPKLEHVIHPTSEVVLELQSLVEISIADCQCLIDLFPSSTAAVLSKLEKVQILRCSSMRYVFGKEAEEEEEDDDMLDLISFPCLRTICVQNLNSLICFFWGTARQLDFPSLEDLQISWCPVLKTFIQRHKSEEVPYLFDIKVVFPNLEKMKLVQLSSLQTIWKNDELLPSNSDSCTRLKSLTVSECKDLQHIFPASFAGNLARLEELCIKSCGAVEEIVMHGDDNGSSEEIDGINSSQMFFFPQLTTLQLNDLPKLRSFFRGSNVSTWSELKKVWIWHCDKVKIFSPKFSSGNSSTRQSLFSVEQVIPKLEILRLVEEDAMRIHDGEFREDMFSELKHFSLSCFHNESAAAFPSRFLLKNKFQKLERLTVFCSSFEETFADKSLSPQEIISYKERFSFAAEGNEKPLARLKELKLSNLNNLKHVWRGDMTVFAEILKSIQLLEVWDCPIMVNLLPEASYTFGNVTTIKVHACNGMKELVTSSAATSLVKLTQLDIYDCAMIETIVSPDGSKTAEEKEEDGELLVICFRELKHIGLHRLPSLTSFSSANCIFEFPSLEEFIVIKCPNLEVFSSNSVVAPKLSKVLLTVKEQMGQVRWDGDLNTTIQNLPK